MNVLFASSEIAPYASTGPLGEAVGVLSSTLYGLGPDVVRVMPMFRGVLEGTFPVKDSGMRFDIPIGFQVHRAEVWKYDSPGPATYFIRRDEYFDRSQLYGFPSKDYTDNFERFVFFQKAVVALIDALPTRPDVVHCHDWQTGLIPLILDHGINGMGRKKKERCVFTIHNLAFQGIYPGSQYSSTNLPFSCFNVDLMEFYGNINSTKAGIIASQWVTTMSRTYAREIQMESHGLGLHGILEHLGERLTGILVGIDPSAWNPQTDFRIPARYSIDDLSGKKLCKKEMARTWNLNLGSKTVFVGAYLHAAHLRDIEVLDAALPTILASDVVVGICIHGLSSTNAEAFRSWTTRWPDRVAVVACCGAGDVPGFISACDMILFPQFAEPGGFLQIFSQRYGTIPVAHATGGLDETIVDAGDASGGGTGFKYGAYSAESLHATFQRALGVYAQNTEWTTLMRSAMKADFTSGKSAQEYLALYRRIMG